MLQAVLEGRRAELAGRRNWGIYDGRHYSVSLPLHRQWVMDKREKSGAGGYFLPLPSAVC